MQAGGPKNEDGAGLMNIEMRRTQRHAVAQHPAAIWHWAPAP